MSEDLRDGEEACGSSEELGYLAVDLTELPAAGPCSQNTTWKGEGFWLESLDISHPLEVSHSRVPGAHNRSVRAKCIKMEPDVPRKDRSSPMVKACRRGTHNQVPVVTAEVRTERKVTNTE